MQYLLLIFDDENRPEDQDPAAQEALIGEYFQYNAWLKDKGQFVGGEALEPSSTATTVRLRDGKVGTTDGPFIETKEQLGGYYVIEAPNLDEAIEAASKIPGARTGAVEVRPLMVIPGDD